MRCHSSERLFLPFLSIVDVQLGLPELGFTCSLRERDHVYYASYLDICLGLAGRFREKTAPSLCTVNAL